MNATVQIATGAYTRPDRGRGTGITLLALDTADPAAGAEVLCEVAAEDPSYLRWSEDGRLLYAITETEPAHLLALEVAADGRSAAVRTDLELRGSGACHLSPGRRPGTLLIAHYGSGSVETVRLDAEGLPAATIDLDDHHDSADGRDPHPHQVRPLDGRELLAVPDLGLDRVFLYRQDAAGEIDLAGQIPLPRGSGPRHLAADHESFQLFVSCELSGSVATAVRQEVPQPLGGLQVMRAPEVEWTVRSVVPASRADGPSAVSHLELTADEDLLLVANRGPDTLAVLSLAGMRPQVVAEVPVGAHPRHFTQLATDHGELVLVAAQEADRIDVLQRRGERLEPAGAGIPAPSVSCVAPRP